MIYRIILCFSLTHLSANLTAQVCDKDIPKIYVSEKAKAVYESKLAEAKINFENYPNADNLIWLGRREAYLGNYEIAIDIYSKGLDQYPIAHPSFRGSEPAINTPLFLSINIA